MQFLTAVDDTRKTLETLVAFPPGTAIARYMEPRLEEIKKAMEETQVELAEATAVKFDPSLSEHEKFAKLSQKFGGYTTEEINIQIREQREEISKTSAPIFQCMT